MTELPRPLPVGAAILDLVGRGLASATLAAMRSTRTRPSGARRRCSPPAALLSVGTVAHDGVGDDRPRTEIRTPRSSPGSSSSRPTSTSSPGRRRPRPVLLDNVYETLVKSTPDGEIAPGLAELEISDDRLTYTLTLQEGVTFHDGDPLTASDVVWSLEQQRAEGANEAPRLASVETVEAPDDATVVITLTEPDNDLAFHLTRRAGAVLNEGATGLENSANGTGPFVFDEWNVGSSITLVRNDDYWGEPASDLRDDVPVLHRSERRGQRAHRRRRRPPTRRSTPTSSSSSRTTPTSWSPTGRPTASSPLGMNNADEVLRPARPPGHPPGDRQAGPDRPVPRLRHADRRTGAAVRAVVRGPLRRLPVRPGRRPGAARGGGLRRRARAAFVAPNIYPTYAPSTSCRSSPTSASRSTSRRSSSRPGSTRCSSTTTTT